LIATWWEVWTAIKTLDAIWAKITAVDVSDSWLKEVKVR